MEINELQKLLQEKSDIIWMTDVRQANQARRLGLVIQKIDRPGGESNLLFIMTKYYAYSDDELQRELFRLHCLIEQGINDIKIEDLKEILP